MDFVWGVKNARVTEGLRWAPLRRLNGLSATRLPEAAKTARSAAAAGGVGRINCGKAARAEVQEYRGQASGQQNRGADETRTPAALSMPAASRGSAAGRGGECARSPHDVATGRLEERLSPSFVGDDDIAVNRRRFRRG